MDAVVKQEFLNEAFVDSTRVLLIFVKEAVVAKRFTILPVSISTSEKDALSEYILLLDTFVKHALVEEKLTMKAEFIEALS